MKPQTLPVLECSILPDSAIDETPSGNSAFLSTGGDGRPPSFRARVSFEATLRPLDLVRIGGKWHLQLGIVDPEDSEGPTSDPLLSVPVGGNDFPLTRALEALVSE